MVEAPGRSSSPLDQLGKDAWMAVGEMRLLAKQEVEARVINSLW